MIDFMTERLIALCDLPDLLPKRNGRPISRSTISRWIRHGSGGGWRLESVQLGGLTYTSVEAVQRFMDRPFSG